ncbi:hypothetical protein MRX96_054613 [Rhipicephalus microplus]
MRGTRSTTRESEWCLRNPSPLPFFHVSILESDWWLLCTRTLKHCRPVAEPSVYPGVFVYRDSSVLPVEGKAPSSVPGISRGICCGAAFVALGFVCHDTVLGGIASVLCGFGTEEFVWSVSKPSEE